MHVDRYLGLVRDAESVLAESLTMIADRHQRDAEIRQTALLLSDWSQRHVAALEPLEERYGVRPTEHARRLRASLFYGTRIGGLGLLLDLQDLSLQVHQVRMLWTALAQVAAELKDKDLQRLCLLAAAETDRQTAWIKTQTKHRAAQAIVVPADPLSEQEASVPARPTAAAIPDPAWSPIAGGVLTLIVGAFSILAGHPWLVPSLGPTAYMQAEMPSHPSTRLYNVLAGHVVGLLAGFFCVWLFAAKDDPIALTTGDITWERVLASALALALTIGVLALLRASHPPAAATALLVGLGSIHNTDQALYLALGALVIAVCGELMRHLRLGDLKTWQPSLAMQRPRFLQPKAARPIGHGHA